MARLFAQAPGCQRPESALAERLNARLLFGMPVTGRQVENRSFQAVQELGEQLGQLGTFVLAKSAG